MQMNEFLNIIKKRLDNYKNLNGNCPKLNEVIFELDELVNIAETQISQSNNGWISVGDKLPSVESTDEYLVYSTHTGQYKTMNTLQLRAMIFISRQITHWQPLPQPPKE